MWHKLNRLAGENHLFFGNRRFKNIFRRNTAFHAGCLIGAGLPNKKLPTYWGILPVVGGKFLYWKSTYFYLKSSIFINRGHTASQAGISAEGELKLAQVSQPGQFRLRTNFVRFFIVSQELRNVTKTVACKCKKINDVNCAAMQPRLHLVTRELL